MKIVLPSAPVTRAQAFAANAMFFYTGKPCKRGHLSVRYVSTGACYDCLNVYKTLAARNPYTLSLVPFDATGIWRPVHWDAATLQRAKVAVQTFIDGWKDDATPAAPEPAGLQVRKVYGERMFKTRDVQDTQGHIHELWTTRTGHPRMQMTVPESGAAGARLLDMFTEDVLRCPEWVFADIGAGPKWYVCEHIDYALYPVLLDDAVAAAGATFGVDGGA